MTTTKMNVDLVKVLARFSDDLHQFETNNPHTLLPKAIDVLWQHVRSIIEHDRSQRKRDGDEIKTLEINEREFLNIVLIRLNDTITLHNFYSDGGSATYKIGHMLRAYVFSPN